MQTIPCVPTLQMRSFSPFGKGDCMGLGGGVGERGLTGEGKNTVLTVCKTCRTSKKY